MSTSSAIEHIKVCVRVRPMNDKASIIKNLDDRSVTICDSGSSKDEKKFTFDKVCNTSTQKEDFYNGSCHDIVQSVLEGYNGTIFAYGQTGSGKTHTMNEVISQAITQIYKSINVDKVHTYKVKYQYLQIYNEQCNDLLSDEPNKNLEIRENKNKSFFVQGLKQELVNNEFELKETLKDKGVNNRKTALTIKNHNSSRSHSILTIILEATEGVTTRTSKLNLVDLAGSESQKNTSASRSLLKEGEKINSSLSVLGRVIRALADNDEHIPYRDSKLTQLLKDSVGGNTKILMIAAISPACYNESLLTLNFAKSVKDIKNKAIKNIATLSTSTTTSTVKMEIFKKKFEDERKKPIESESKVEELQKKLIESESNEELQKKVGVSTIEVECYTIDQIKDDDQLKKKDGKTPRHYTSEEDQIILQARMETPKNFIGKAEQRLKENGTIRSRLSIQSRVRSTVPPGSEEVGHIPTPVPKPYTFEEDQIILQAQMENPKNWTDKAMNRLEESGFYRTIWSIQSRFSKRLRDRSDEAVITDENKENNPVAQISSNTSRGISTRKRTSADAHVDTVNASKNLSKRSRILT